MAKAKVELTADEIIEECANVILQRAGRDWRAGTAMFQECVNHANAILALRGTYNRSDSDAPTRQKRAIVEPNAPKKTKQNSNWPSAR